MYICEVQQEMDLRRFPFDCQTLNYDLYSESSAGDITWDFQEPEVFDRSFEWAFRSPEWFLVPRSYEVGSSSGVLHVIVKITTYRYSYQQQDQKKRRQASLAQRHEDTGRFSLLLSVARPSQEVYPSMSGYAVLI